MVDSIENMDETTPSIDSPNDGDTVTSTISTAINGGVENINENGVKTITTFADGAFMRSNPIDYEQYERFQEVKQKQDEAARREYRREMRDLTLMRWIESLPYVYRSASYKSIVKYRPDTAECFRKMTRRIMEDAKAYVREKKPIKLPNILINPRTVGGKGGTFTAYAYLNFLVSSGIIDQPDTQVFVADQTTMIDLMSRSNDSVKGEAYAKLRSPLLRVVVIDSVDVSVTDKGQNLIQNCWSRLFSLVSSRVSFVFIFRTAIDTMEDKRAKDFVNQVIPMDYKSDYREWGCKDSVRKLNPSRPTMQSFFYKDDEEHVELDRGNRIVQLIVEPTEDDRMRASYDGSLESARKYRKYLFQREKERTEKMEMDEAQVYANTHPNAQDKEDPYDTPEDETMGMIIGEDGGW